MNIKPNRPPSAYPSSATSYQKIASQNQTWRPRMTAMTASDFDWKPLALVPLLAARHAAAGGLAQHLAHAHGGGLAMGMIIFIIASGLTLVFGLMDVLNFGHGVFIALGALWPPACWARWATGRARPSCGATWWPCCPPCWWPWRWQARWAWRLSASSCGPCTASTSSRSSSPWAA